MSAIVPPANFSLRVEGGGTLAFRPRVVLTLTPDELRWQIGDARSELRSLDEIRSVTLGHFILPRGSTAWRCRIEFQTGAPLSVISLSGETAENEAYRQFVRSLHARLVANRKSPEIIFAIASAGRFTSYINFVVLPLAGLGCLASAFASGQFMLLLLVAVFWVVAVIQTSQLRINNGRHYDPTDLPQPLLP